mmetsp:Transcript_11583/g.18189  ORF Transcript_11583/g.18189 Transcript_11583/m.18189 type:complete len:140 (+) Transcript_11583:164-583(+)|eukprot:CAMPEP_0184310302 /NCGR_PEP_ID=MMETSP1049-20130417/26793_1 /TAXON_ID=77928 /ORGANISM="Proteomonas sulcata, Strain CCMP704" /LENGTH=139 /DNA_ID=CAMNT_0026624199 /DNA_START=164 /DNA_END=583 /DNA_ORIENTATION=+
MPPHEMASNLEPAAMRCFLSQFARQAVIDPKDQEESADDWDEDDDSCLEGWTEMYDQLCSEDQQRQAMRRQQAEQAARQQWENEKPEEGINQKLGTIIYVKPGHSRMCAGQTESGNVIFEGKRYQNIQDWLRQVLSKRI